VVDRLAALAGRAQQDLHVLAQFGLADEFVEPPRAKAYLLPFFGGEGFGRDQLLPHRAAAKSFKASRNNESTSPSDGSSRSTSRTSSGW
jgi:hypothetical protein